MTAQTPDLLSEIYESGLVYDELGASAASGELPAFAGKTSG